MFAKEEGSKAKKESAACQIMEQDLSDDEFQQIDFKMQEDECVVKKHKEPNSVANDCIQDADEKQEEPGDMSDAPA